MKKLLAIGLSSLLFLSACGSDETKAPEDAGNGGESSAADKTEAKRELMRFYMAVPNAINEVDGELNVFEQQQEKDLLPEGSELAELKESAGISAEETVAAVETIEIPESLSGNEEKIQSALDLIAESYKLKAGALAEEEISFEPANEKFSEADEIFNALLVENELIPSSLQNEVN